MKHRNTIKSADRSMRIILAQENHTLRKMLLMPTRTEQLIFDKGIILIQWVELQPSQEGYEFLQDYIELRQKSLTEKHNDH